MVDAAFERVMFFKGTPETRTFYDVVYIPWFQCLYSRDGFRIDESCLWRDRGDARQLINKAPETITPFAVTHRFVCPLIYVGECFQLHYGHFLVESISRLWYAVGNEHYQILCHPFVRYKPAELFIDRFFGAVGFSPRRFVSFIKPVLLSEVVVPSPSFGDRLAGFDVHRLIPESVAERLLVRTPKRTTQPLYLSRTKLPPGMRRTANEDKLETILSDKGYAIAHPEKLPLQRQIYLLNKHECIVSMMGSALHGALFDISPESCRHIVCLSYKQLIANNYLIIDAMKKVTATYIGSIDRMYSGERWQENHSLDLEAALRGLRQTGLL